jgi:hypothetical protein
MHGFARMVVFALALVTTLAVGAQDRVGVRIPGASGVTRTTADLMAQQASAPAVTTVRELRPRLRANLVRHPNPNVLPDPPTPKSAQIAISVEPKIAQSATTNFLGARTSDSGFIPPDSMGAVGPTQFIVAVNGRVRSFDKISGAPDGILDVHTDIFFASELTPVGGAVVVNDGASDPRIRFDRSSARWFITMIDIPCADLACNTTTPNRVMIAVSDTPAISATTNWTFFHFTPSANFVDYPMLGIDNNALYIGANIFDSTGGFVNTDAYVVQKSSVLGAGPIVVTAFTGLISDINCTLLTDNGPYAPMGTDNFNAAAEGYFVGVSWCNGAQLVVRRVVNPGTGAPTLSANLAVNTPNFLDVGTQPHLGNTRGATGNLDASDTRLMSAQVRNGVLYTAHAISVDATGAAISSTNAAARNGARWYQLASLTTVPALFQAGTTFDSTATDPQTTNVRWFAYPGIQVNGQGNMAMGFTVSGPLQRANAAFTGRLPGDAAGATDAPTLYTNTLAAYNLGSTTAGSIRWGDFSYTSVDPNDDQTMWTIQEYADANNSWGVRAAKLLAPPPATPSAYTNMPIPAGTASTTFTLTGTSTNGSGFFDPGPGFASRLSVDIPGVTVTGVTFVSPTQLTVTVSTVGSTPGLKLVRVNNPDGQFAQDAALLFTVTGTAAPFFSSANSLICAVGSPCNFTFTTGAGPAASVISEVGALPAGVNFVAPSLSGTPLAGSQGTYVLTMTAANGTLPNAQQIFTLIVTATCGGFTDVIPTAAYCNQTEWLKNRGITLGCTSATLFCPNDVVTRGSMALFMQRLGDVIAPNAFSDNVISTGPLTIDSRPNFCTTTDFPATNFPRVAWITWSFDGNATAPLTARVFTQSSFDNGANFATNEANLMRVTAQGSGWVGTSATVKVSIPAGTSPRFRMKTDRELGTSTSGNFSGARCNIGALFMSVNGGASPYDTPPGPSEQP